MIRMAAVLRAGALLALASGGTFSVAAAVWLDPNWALVGELRPLVVYDSNLTARSGGVSDAYGVLTPKLTLSRRGSATRFELDGQVERTWFRDHDEFDSTDPQINLVYAYPAAPGDEARTQVNLHWGRDSSTNTDLGRRLRSDNVRGRWDQRLFDTGRTVLDLRLDGRSTDYREIDLNTNKAYAIEARAGYSISPQVRVGLGYGHEWTRSLGTAARGDTEGDEDRIMARVFGDLLPKLRGSLETGVAFVEYTGVVNREDTAWIGAVSLTWDPSAETAVTIRAGRYNDFSPDGATALRSEIMLDLSRDVGRGFSVRGGAGAERLRTFFSGEEHHSDAVILWAGLAYQLTDRFAAELTERWTRRSADRALFEYDRNMVTGQMTFLF